MGVDQYYGEHGGDEEEEDAGGNDSSNAGTNAVMQGDDTGM